MCKDAEMSSYKHTAIEIIYINLENQKRNVNIHTHTA